MLRKEASARTGKQGAGLSWRQSGPSPLHVTSTSKAIVNWQNGGRKKQLMDCALTTGKPKASRQGRVVSLSWFISFCPRFSTESPTRQKRPQSWAHWEDPFSPRDPFPPPPVLSPLSPGPMDTTNSICYGRWTQGQDTKISCISKTTGK